MGLFGLFQLAVGRTSITSGENNLNSSEQDTARLIDEGNALEDQGRIEEAMQRYEAAILLTPNLARAHLNRGNILLATDKAEEALAAYMRALTLNPDYAAACYNLGNTHARLGQHEAAEAAYREAIRLKPDFADAEVALGCMQEDLGRTEEAVASYRRALQIRPDYAEVHWNLGKVLKELGKIDEAMVSHRHALAIYPDYAEAYSGLGIALAELGQFDAAVENFHRALVIKPGHVEALSNLGVAQTEIGQLDAAVESYRRALEIEPDNAEVHGSLGVTLLKKGCLSEGWPEYEYRWKGRSPPLRHPSALQQWTGQRLSPEDRLLVFTEQGMGDMLQFARYLPVAAQCFPGGVSIVAGGSLRALLRSSFPMIEVLDTAPADQRTWQWQCPLLSLPLAFGTTLETIPGKAPYLSPEPAQIAYWQARIATLGLPALTRKIGVVWRPGAAMKTARLKAVSLQTIAPLLNQANNAWFSLQKEPDPDIKRCEAARTLVDWSENFVDFNATAALAVNMDLIISVDTSIAHLAGGLGLPTWLFNRHASDWRWMLNREDSPWYPTIRIFTQEKAGDWDGVARRMSAVLAAMPLPTQYG